MSKRRPIREIVVSQRFKREVSLLLFFFAAVNAIFSFFYFVAAASHQLAFEIGVGTALMAVIYGVLALFIRRGSTVALVITGALFLGDTLLTLLGPSWEDARAMIIARGLLIFVVVRYIYREQRTEN
jgi:hypothetical protein